MHAIPVRTVVLMCERVIHFAAVSKTPRRIIIPLLLLLLLIVLVRIMVMRVLLIVARIVHRLKRTAAAAATAAAIRSVPIMLIVLPLVRPFPPATMTRTRAWTGTHAWPAIAEAILRPSARR